MCIRDRYQVHYGYAKKYGERTKAINDSIRDFYQKTGVDLPQDHLLPEDVLASSVRMAAPHHRYFDKKQNRWVASAVHNVQFISDRKTGRIFEMQIVVEQPPGSGSRITRVY